MGEQRLNSSTRIYSLFEIAFIVGLAAVPLFIDFPYRVNIFLSWEGAYRISEGQIPFRDFGTPSGGMYWVIPAIFFKIFGPAMITLVKAQVFISIVSGLAFRSILKSLKVMPGIRVACVLLYVASYSFFNFWPWYNHSVIVYEFIAIAFLLKGINAMTTRKQWLWLSIAGLFTTFSFLTKQDAGGMALLIAGALVGYVSLHEKKWSMLLAYVGGFIGSLLIIIFLVFGSGFSYWFNHGQAPHTARVSGGEIIEELMTYSTWIKFYVVMVAALVIFRFPKWKDLWSNKMEMLFLLLTLGILCESAIFQVTSYTPPDNNIFFHAFATAYIFYSLSKMITMPVKQPTIAITLCVGVMFVWSGVFWNYVQRIVGPFLHTSTATVSPTGENIVNRQTYLIRPTVVDTTEPEVPMGQWVECGLKSFRKIKMPPGTAQGIQRIMNMDMVKSKRKLKVLNMSELTPLAVEIPYELERGPHYPLWYHLGVGMFNKQAAMFEERIGKKEYDLVLFEYIPTLNNFYPFRTREKLQATYKLIDSFEAPRRGDTRGKIEVYVRE